MNTATRRTLLLAAALLAAGALASDYPRAVEGGVLFSYRDEGARNVHWAGDYNGWDTSADAFEDQGDGLWTAVIPLGPGEHQYKFVVDGNWLADPSNPQLGGDYGNSLIRVDEDGEVVEAGGAPTPSPLNSKLFVDGFYYVQMRAAALEEEDRRVQVRKPTHSLNLGFDVELNPSLAGRVEVNADNVANPAEMWRTALNFQRARLVLTRPAFTLTLFENEALFLSDEALGLVGRVGTYAYDYGYGARGGLLEASLPFGFGLSALLADSGVDSPYRPSEPDRGVDEGEGSVINYNRTENAGYRDDWVLQLSRELGPGRFLYLGRAERGATPGYLWFQDDLGDGAYDRYYYRTVQNDQLHALSYRLDAGGASLELEWLRGRADLQAKDRSWEWRGTEAFVATEQAELSWRVQESRGLVLEAAAPLPWGFSLGVRHRFLELRNLLVEDGRELAARSLDYGGTLAWKAGPASWSLELSQAEYHYDEGLGWGDQFAFDAGEIGYGNPFIRGDRLPLEAYTQLGYGSVSRLRQGLRLLLHEGEAGDMLMDLRHTVASTRLDRDPFYWEFLAELDWRFHEEWSFLFNQRLADYSQDFLDIDAGYGASFVELSYHLNRGSWLSLSWGVDPYWLDPVSKTFLPHGRREFLAVAGLDEAALKESYLGLGRAVDRAESALRDARRMTLEARFGF